MNQESVLNKPVHQLDLSGCFKRIIDHNPFFLVSGVLMLAGCFMINGSAHEHPRLLWPVVALIAVFNVYELLIIGLVICLTKPRRFYRDAGFLLLLEVLLMADVSLAYNEVLIKDLPVAMIVCAIALALARVKLLLICRGIKLRPSPAGAWMTTFVIMLIFLLPGTIRELIRHEWIHEGHYHLAWWLISTLPLLAALTGPWYLARRYGKSERDRLKRWCAGLLVVIPITSVVLHLRAAYYIDDRAFYYYNLAPLILGLTAAWLLKHSHKSTRSKLAGVAVFWAVIAGFVSLWHPHYVVMPWTSPDGWVLSPMRLTLVMAGLLLLVTAWRCRAYLNLPVAGGMWLAASMGHSVDGIIQNTQAACHWLAQLGSGVIPDTVMGWGMLSVVGAFVFLALGAISVHTASRPGYRNAPD